MHFKCDFLKNQHSSDVRRTNVQEFLNVGSVFELFCCREGERRYLSSDLLVSSVDLLRPYPVMLESAPLLQWGRTAGCMVKLKSLLSVVILCYKKTRFTASLMLQHHLAVAT